MKEKIITEITQGMLHCLDNGQLAELRKALIDCLDGYHVSKEASTESSCDENDKLVSKFLSAKRVEGCSEKTIVYYKNTIEALLIRVDKEIKHITTDDLRDYLTNYQIEKSSSKVTIDNIRRILSSFFSWLEDEDYIIKSPVRRIHKVKTGKIIKETYSDESLELMRDNCPELRDLAMIDLLASTGMRVGEMVLLNKDDINFNERECVVFGKGDKERVVYFDARAKIHMINYLESRSDNNPALFVTLRSPQERLKIGGVEVRLRELGKRLNIPKVHPHKFRRTLATVAIDNETEELSYDDFIRNTNKNIYDTAFAVLNKQVKTDLSTEGFEASIAGMEQSGIKLETYVKEFEYSYALAQTKGVFSKGELTVEDMLDTTLELMGVDPTTVQKMSEMDTSAMLNQMYYTVAGLLPIFILIVILANSLIAEQVDRGSMAYVLSTPTKRSAVAITQMIFMIVAPLVIISIVGATRIGTSFLFYDEVNVPGLVALFAGMYLLVEAASAIGYFGSCLFSQSKKSMGFVGGLSTWFILSSLIGMFGAENMVNTGMGVEQLGIFNKLTIIGLYDIDTLATVGTSNLDSAFVWKLVVLATIAVVCYIVGAIKFLKKDLPL